MFIPRNVDLDFISDYVVHNPETWRRLPSFMTTWIEDKVHQAHDTPLTFTHCDYVALQRLIKALDEGWSLNSAEIVNTLCKYLIDAGEGERVRRVMF